jgi:Domain of unknown function (DUF4167)
VNNNFMRSNQNKNNNNRNRNRNNNNNRRNTGGGGGGPNNKVFDSNGPDIKLRGTTQTIAEKYMQLGRDAQSAGDSVMAENYYQHAEHYYRLWAASQPIGHSLLMSRKLGEEEFEDDGDDQGQGEDEGEQGQVDIAQGDAAVDGSVEQAANGDGQQPRQNRNNNNGQRDNNGTRDNNGRGFRPRWQNNRNNRNYENRDAGAPENGAVEPNADVASMAPEAPTPTPAAEEGRWEAPSFLQRPTPAATEEVSQAEHVVAEPVQRKPRARKPRVEVEAIAETTPDNLE